MQYPVSVLVPTIYGRIDALLYQAHRPRAGVVLIESPTGAGSLVEHVYDEVALYFRAAGISVVRLAVPCGTGSTQYAANVLGCVALLRSASAREVVLIVQTECGDSSWNRSRQDDADLAYAGFLDLITTHAATPERFAELLAGLVDTIRTVIDTVVGIARLLPPGSAQALAPRAPLSAPSAGHFPLSQDEDEDQDGVSTVYTLTLPQADEHTSAIDYIAPLYAWTLSQLQPADAGDARGAWGELDDQGAPAHARKYTRLSEVIWAQLGLAWCDILGRLEMRSPERARRIHDIERHIERNGEEAPPPGMVYGRTWVHLDSQARVEWLAACTQVFPLRPAASPAV